MKTAEFEILLGTDPRLAERKAEAKALQQNGECVDAELRLARALKFEHVLDQAFEIDMPDALQAKLFAIARADVAIAPSIDAHGVWRSRRWLAIAAGVSMFAIAAFIGYQGNTQPLNARLAQHCNEHMTHEPFAVTRRTVVPNDLVERMFAMNGFATQGPDGRALTSALGEVNYLSPCSIDGKTAMHLVVQTAAGPVTVLVMPDIANDGASEARIGGALIRISPLSNVQNARGAIAFVAESSVSVDAVEARFLQALGAV